jgi:glycosyltransferase involved in cell wall biosynthesis
MKVLILSQYFWPESFRINEVATSLVAGGCEVTVLTGQPNYPGGVIFDGYSAARTGHEAFGVIDIFRVPLIPRGKGGAIGLMLNYLSFLIAASIVGPWVLRGRRFDVIFVYAISPILQAIAGVVLKRIKRAALVIWVQDLWPESLEATGFVRNRSLLRGVALVVRWIYQRADLLLVQSQAFVPRVMAMCGRTPVHYHPNPGDRLNSSAPPLANPVTKLGPGFNVVFAGNLGTVQSLESVLDAAEMLLPYRDIRLVLVGSGSRSEWLQQQVSARSLVNVELLGRFPPEAMPAIFAQASALLVSLIRNPIMELTIPSKIQAYLAAGRPIIAALDGEGARIVRDAGAGLSCDAENARLLADSVIELQAMPTAKLNDMGESGRRYYSQHFEPESLARKLVQQFTSVTVDKK